MDFCFPQEECNSILKETIKTVFLNSQSDCKSKLTINEQKLINFQSKLSTVEQNFKETQSKLSNVEQKFKDSQSKLSVVEQTLNYYQNSMKKEEITKNYKIALVGDKNKAVGFVLKKLFCDEFNIFTFIFNYVY